MWTNYPGIELNWFEALWRLEEKKLKTCHQMSTCPHYHKKGLSRSWISQEQMQNVQKWKMLRQSVQKLSLSLSNLWSSCHSYGSFKLAFEMGNTNLPTIVPSTIFIKNIKLCKFQALEIKGFFLMFSFKYEEYVIKFNDIYNALVPAIFINEAIT